MIYLFKQKINVTPYSKRDAMVNNWQNLYHRLRNTGFRIDLNAQMIPTNAVNSHFI